MAAGATFHAEWAAATSLNESLAVWMELHSVRGDPALTDLVQAYIRNGPYPEWSYAGAARVEALYEREGPDAVRALVRSLRDDPVAAVQHFEAPGV
jgi:hypothetical protein